MPKTGLDGLLRPEDSVLALVDHQAFQFANLHSHEPTMIVNNVVGLAKSAKLFGVPTILSTVLADRGGYLIKGIQDVFPEQRPIDRTLINSWQDKRVVEAIRKTGRKQLVLAALWTEICLAMTAIHALADGFDVFIVTDASGGASVEYYDNLAVYDDVLVREPAGWRFLERHYHYRFLDQTPFEGDAFPIA